MPCEKKAFFEWRKMKITELLVQNDDFKFLITD